MARTAILPTDPAAVKLFSAEVAVDAAKKGYFSGKMEGSEAQKLPLVRKTDLESGAGDEVTMNLVAKLVGQPIQGSEKLEGREMRLRNYTDKLRVDKFRNGVNIGDVMDQKRVKFSLREQAKARLTDYIAEVEDEMKMMYMAGARGVGTEIQHFPTDWTAFPNAFEAPDAYHLMYGGDATAKANVDSADKIGLAVLDRAKARAKKFMGVEGAGAKTTPVEIQGGQHYVALLSVESEYDLRRETGDMGWLAIQKAAAAAEGAKNPIFTGALGMYNDVIIHSHENVIKFTDYGAGANVPACRNLFMGAHCAAVAYGFKGNGGVRYQLSESGLDHDEETVVHFRTILGIKKTRFNSMDFGLQTIDCAFTAIV